MKLKDYPKEIQELIVKRHKEYCKEYELMEFLDTSVSPSYLFDFSDTEEGIYFWQNVDADNLQPFYDKYPVPDTRDKK